MARRGRRRKLGQREANGRIKRSNKPQVEPISGALWQRIVQHGKKLGLDERLTSEVGRLNRFGELSQAQTLAALRMAEVYGRYERLKGLRRMMRSPSYEVGFRGESGIDESLLTPGELSDLLARQRATIATFENLNGKRDPDSYRYTPGVIPAALRSWLEMLCVEDRVIPAGHYPAVRDVLDRLAAIWHLDFAGGRKGGGAQATPHKQAAEKPEPARQKAPRIDYDKVHWLAMMRQLAPDAREEELDARYDMVQAQKQRDRFRRETARKVIRGKAA